MQPATRKLVLGMRLLIEAWLLWHVFYEVKLYTALTITLIAVGAEIDCFAMRLIDAELQLVRKALERYAKQNNTILQTVLNKMGVKVSLET